MSSDKKVCPRCKTELDPTKVVVTENNPEPYPQGSAREYICRNCGYKFMDEGITEGGRPS